MKCFASPLEQLISSRKNNPLLDFCSQKVPSFWRKRRNIWKCIVGVKGKQRSNEVFDDCLGWPLYLVVMEVQWFHKKTPLPCRSLARSIKGERDLVVAGFCDVISRLCFDLHFVWTGEDAADVRTIFCREKASSRWHGAGMEVAGEGEECSCLMWSLSQTSSSCWTVSSLAKCKMLACPGMFNKIVPENFLRRYMTIMTWACVYSSCFVKGKSSGNVVIHQIITVSRTGSQDCWSQTLTSTCVFLSSLKSCLTEEFVLWFGRKW